MKHRWYTLFYILKVNKVTLCIWRRLVFWGFSAKEILRYLSDVVNLLNYINMSTHRITITSFSTSIMPKKPLVPIRRHKMKKLASHSRKLWSFLFRKLSILGNVYIEDPDVVNILHRVFGFGRLLSKKTCYAKTNC